MTTTVVRGEFLAESLPTLKQWFRDLEDSGIHFVGEIESYDIEEA